MVAEAVSGTLVAPRPATAGRLMRFTVGGFPYVLPLERTAEVLAIGSATATAPRGWVGTLVRNERPVPIGDLAFLLGVSPLLTSRRDIRAIILRESLETVGGVRFGVTVEQVPQVIDGGNVPIAPLPGLVRQNPHVLVRGSLILGAELCLLLDADLLVARLEAGVVRAADGRITELRSLPRRQGESTRLAMPLGEAAVPPVALQHDTTALLLPHVETADGGGGFLPALPMAWVQEVRPPESPRPLPQAPAVVQGLIVWRGRCLPVIDLSHRLTGIPSAQGGTASQRLVVIGPPGGEALGALLVSGVRGLGPLAAAAGQETPPPDLIDPTLLAAWTRRGDDLVALLHPPAFFA